MTDEQFEILKKYEDKLRAAVNCSFMRLTHSEFSEIAAVYDQLYTPLRVAQRNCNSCRLNAVKTIGRDYFKVRNEKAEAERIEREKAKEGKGDEIKKVSKAGRPKKIKLDD